MKYKGRGLMIVVYNKSDSLVGFQSRFQTAGNLIYKPEQQSTLHVNGNCAVMFRKIEIQ